MNLLNRTFRWANLLVILATLLAYFSPYADPSRMWVFAFPGLAYPFLLALNLFFIGYWTFKKNRYAWLSAACILVGFGYFLSFFGWHFFSGGKGGLTVMTYNVQALEGLSNKGERKIAREHKAGDIRQLAQTYGHPDLLCVQEGAAKVVMETVMAEFGYPRYFKEKGTLIFSKYAIEDKGVLPFKNTENSCIWADIATPSGTVRVYSAHLQSNRMTQTATKVVTEGDLREKNTWRNIRFVMQRYRQAAAVRAGQARLLAAHIAKSPHPVILCGDFNDTPLSYAYRILSNGMQDSFCEAGRGIGTTFAGKLPALRIDYVLASPHFRIKSHRVLGLKLSDHFPVWARLELESKKVRK